MRKRRAKPGEQILSMKVTLSDPLGRAKGKPYRVLAIPEGFTLYCFAEAIVESFNFEFDHLFGFYDNIKNWTQAKEGYELTSDEEEFIGEPSRYESVQKYRVNKAFEKINKKMLFLFDYGDEWHFIVELKEISTAQKEVKYPLVIESVGEAPPQYDYGEDDEEDEEI